MASKWLRDDFEPIPKAARLDAFEMASKRPRNDPLDSSPRGGLPDGLSTVHLTASRWPQNVPRDGSEDVPRDGPRGGLSNDLEKVLKTVYATARIDGFEAVTWRLS
jgi:hypothetical protein